MTITNTPSRPACAVATLTSDVAPDTEIAALKRNGVDLVQLYRRPDADPFSRLRFEKPRAETLRDFYRSHVDLLYDLRRQYHPHRGTRGCAP